MSVSTLRAWLSRSVLQTMMDEADSHYPNETGGVLIGYFSADDPERCVIVDASGPGPSAQHERYRFSPNAEFQERYISDAYRTSGRIHTYLGDWHTHPDGALALSGKDKRTMRSIARTPEARLPRPLMSILAGHPERWEFGLWQLVREGWFSTTLAKAVVTVKP